MGFVRQTAIMATHRMNDAPLEMNLLFLLWEMLRSLVLRLRPVADIWHPTAAASSYRE